MFNILFHITLNIEEGKKISVLRMITEGFLKEALFELDCER